jgi:putative two-component system response regulator
MKPGSEGRAPERIVHRGALEAGVPPIKVPIKVLIIDDDAIFRQATALVLDDEGYETRQASTGADARGCLDAAPDIAAVLCDIQIPGESGLDLLAHLAADFPDLAIVMTTGADDPQTANLAFEIGADGYLIKPFTTNEILLTLTNALRRRRLESARQRHVGELEHTIDRLRTLTGVLQGIEAPPTSIGNEDDTIGRLSRAISLRDEETGRHLERMSRYSAILAESAGYTGGSVEQVRLATALHDVGKIGVPDIILLKPGALSPDEYTAMQRHAQIGCQLLAGSNSELLEAASAVALSHHEWWDGTGYPEGLSGDRIPEVARIAAVADVFDALTSNRVYRPGFPSDEAIAIMSELRGRQFEPRLLDAFLGLMDEVVSIREAYPDQDDGPERIRVLVVDDHEIFAHSLVRLLGSRPDLKMVGTAGSVSEAVAVAVAYAPDVILMDFELPDGDGAQATAQIKVLTPSVKVVMLTARTDDQALVRAIAAGCSGFVKKEEAVEKLLDAIVAVHDGEAITPPSNLTPLLRQLQPTHRGLGSNLTPRELDILRLIATGWVNKQIAQQLGLSLNTIRNHAKNILHKLQAHSKLEAVATAVREGIITYPGESVRS